MDVVFLLIVKELHWYEGSKKKVVDTAPKSLKDYVPTVGDITWVSKISLIDITTKEINLDVSSVHIERNKFAANIDPTCFEILHTSNQKLKRK